MAPVTSENKIVLAAHINLANGITSLSIAASLTAMFLTATGRVIPALFAGVITLPCDVFDGVIARWRKTTSAFGAQLDSLSDAVGFGVLPALLGYLMGLNGVSAVVLIAYTLSAVWRLAWFQEAGLTRDAAGREYFSGIPTTFAAGVFYIIAPASFWVPPPARLVLLFSFYLLTAFLMNSRVRFPKKGWPARIIWVAVPIALASLLFLRDTSVY
jgi:CDP-diacylglycerol--serine O-phosphatidyltransferase